MKSCGNPIVASMKSAYARSTMAGVPLPMSRGSSSQRSWASRRARDTVEQK